MPAHNESTTRKPDGLNSLAQRPLGTQQRGPSAASDLSGLSSVMVIAPLRGSGLCLEPVVHQANRMLPCSRFAPLSLLITLLPGSSGLSLGDSCFGRLQMTVLQRPQSEGLWPILPAPEWCLSLLHSSRSQGRGWARCAKAWRDKQSILQMFPFLLISCDLTLQPPFGKSPATPLPTDGSDALTSIQDSIK